jgi:superfamily I DNA and/or RNA helicase
MNDKTYNGYPTYETWATKLWLDNEEGTYREMGQLTKDATSAYELSKTLKEWVEDDFIFNALRKNNGLAMDLLMSAAHEIDYEHIANNLWEEYGRDKEEEDEEVESQYGFALYAEDGETKEVV